MEGFRRVDLAATRYGDLKFLVAVPRPGEPWGALAPLRGTTWGSLIPVVSGDAMSHALHGNPQALLAAAGRPPQHQGKQLPLAERRCEVRTGCLLHRDSHCFVASGKLPECFIAAIPGDHEQMLAAYVALAWDEGRYVVVVEGGEFVL